MNRLVRGSVILAAVALVGACGGLDTDGIDETAELVADPGVVFVNNTDSQAVFVEALNSLGQQLAGDFTVTNVGPGLSVNYDTTFAPRPGVEDLPTRVRYFVRGADPATFVSSSFTVTANGQSVTIPVNITPANFPATFNLTTANVGDTIIATAPAPLSFSSASSVTFGTTPAIVVGISADSSTMSFILPPGVNSAIGTFTGLRLPYLSSNQTLLATTAISTTNVTNYTGTDAQGTAPVIATPASGATTGFFDVGTWLGDCGGVPCQWYQIDVAAAVDLSFNSTWDNTSDLGIYVFESDGSTGVGACDAHGNGATAKPEQCVISLPAAGTYFIQMQNFAPFYPDPDPAWFMITMTAP